MRKYSLQEMGVAIAVMLSMDTYNGIIPEETNPRISKELREVEKEIRLGPSGKEVRKGERHLSKHQN